MGRRLAIYSACKLRGYCERLIVLHTLPEDKLDACLALLAKSDLPALWKPRPDQFVHVDLLPHLGKGKLDLRRLKEIATESSV